MSRGWVAVLFALSACATAPKAPLVDEILLTDFRLLPEGATVACA